MHLHQQGKLLHQNKYSTNFNGKTPCLILVCLVMWYVWYVVTSNATHYKQNLIHSFHDKFLKCLGTKDMFLPGITHPTVVYRTIIQFKSQSWVCILGGVCGWLQWPAVLWNIFLESMSVQETPVGWPTEFKERPLGEEEDRLLTHSFLCPLTPTTSSWRKNFHWAHPVSLAHCWAKPKMWCM